MEKFRNSSKMILAFFTYFLNTYMVAFINFCVGNALEICLYKIHTDFLNLSPVYNNAIIALFIMRNICTVADGTKFQTNK